MQHVGFDFVHSVPSGSRPKSADRLPAGSAIDFRGPTNVELGTELDPFCAMFDVANDTAADAKVRITLKVIEALLEIIWLEGQIAIQFDNKLPVIGAYSVITIVECFDHAATGLAKAAIKAVHGTDPRMLRGIFVDDGRRAIGGAVVNDDPLEGTNGLREHALDGEAKISFFIANWRNDNIIFSELGHERRVSSWI